MMIPTKLYVEPNQEKRIMTAFRKKKGCQIKAKKQANGSYHGEMLLTPEQWLKYQKVANGRTVNLPFTHGHLVKNMKHKGGFLALIAAAKVFDEATWLIYLVVLAVDLMENVDLKV